MAEPFLRWAGGKRKLLPVLLKHAPKTFGRYYEPFVGGGALFFAVGRQRATIGDANESLVTTYKVVRDYVDDLIAVLGGGHYINDEARYYEIRAEEPVFDLQRAARFIYLNRTCFNGLYRVNSSGGFNVPWGKLSNPTICDVDRLRAASTALRHCRIEHQPFDAGVAQAQQGDFVYFDPPYWPASDTANFTAFTQGGFTAEDQIRLRDVARNLIGRKVFVVLSNSDTSFTRDLYGDASAFQIHEISARRDINRDGAKRGPVGELIITGVISA